MGVLKDDGITIILRFEEGNRENRRHGIPEKEVLLAAISWVESMTQLAYSNIPSDPVKPVAHKELNGFRDR
jgi:hypothetical protein